MTIKRRLQLWRENRNLSEDVRKSLSETIAAFSIKIVGAALSFAFSILLARTYGAAGVGQFGLAITTLTIATVVSLVGLDYVLIRTVSGDIGAGRADLARGTIRSVTKIVLVTTATVWTLMTFVALPIMNARFNMAEDSAVLSAITIGLLPFVLMRVASSSLRSTGHVLLAQALDGPVPMGLAMLCLSASLLLGLAVSIVAASWIYIGALTLVVVIGLGIYANSVRNWAPPAKVDVRPLLKQGWPIFAVAVTGFVVDWFILIVLASSTSAVEVGQFRTAWQITSLLNLVVVSFDAVAGPRIAAAWRRGDIDQIGSMWRQAVVIIMVMSLPVIAVLFAWPQLVLGVFGDEFRAADSALRILLVGQLVNVITGPVGSILIMTGREKLSFAYSSSATVLAILLGLILIPHLGLVGAALTSAATICFRNLCAFAIATRAIGLRFWPK